MSQRHDPPRFYALNPGMLLKQLRRLEAEAKTREEDPAHLVYRWLQSAAVEIACQMPNPSDDWVQEVMVYTSLHIKRAGGAPLGNKNARKKPETENN